MSSLSNTMEDNNTSDDEYQDALSKTNHDFIKEQENLDNNEEWKTPLLDRKENKTNNAEEFSDCQEDLIDEDGLKELEKDMTREELECSREKAVILKTEGNEAFRNGDFKNSADLYTAALKLCPTSNTNDRAVLYSNRGAAKMSMEMKKGAIDDCTKAIELNPNYLRALLRRAKLYSETEKLDESLEDFKQVLELEKNNKEALEAVIRIPPLIEARNEKLKEEMVGKLKDLGNMFLKPFGLSTNNFQMQKNENTGSYSINFNQKSS